MLGALYKSATTLGAPLIALYLQSRMQRGREDATRFPERLGHASRPRPQGKLLWCHAASVGESVSLLALLAHIRNVWPELHVLVTTGTVTSAKLVASRLPANMFHQYVPVDRLPYVQRFLNHWKPDAALWVESELWPNMLHEMKQRKIPATLLNARMSPKSFRHWQMAKGWAQEMMATFDMCLAQGAEDEKHFAALGAKNVVCPGNLKYAADALPYDDTKLEELRHAVDARPVWLMASTHEGEEEIAARVHRKLEKQFPDLLTIVVPRHAVRGHDIAHKISASYGMKAVQRSQGTLPDAATGFYLADTMAELGLFYRLAPLAVMGGSFTPVGGHNPIEPAQLDAMIILGPHMQNFAEITAAFLSRNAARQVTGEAELEQVLRQALQDKTRVATFASAARQLATEQKNVLTKTMDILSPWLERNLK